MKIVIAISSLRCGGSERVAALLANAWAERGWSVTVLTLSAADLVPFYELNPKVTHVALGLLKPSGNKFVALINNFARIRAIRNSLRASAPDIVLSFMESMNICTILANRGLGYSHIISEVAVPALQKQVKIWEYLRDLVFRFSSALVVPSAGVCSFYLEHSKVLPVVIPNPVVSDAELRTVERSQVRSSTLVAMGRLSEEKGFDLLLDAMVELVPKCPEVTLDIYGEGPLRPQLEARRDSLNLKKVVTFQGITREPLQRLREHGIFVLSSRYEGFGNVLIEAMSQQVPVVSFDCPTGPREIIQDGQNGLLVSSGSSTALAEALLKVIINADLRQQLVGGATETVQKFSMERVLGQWDQLFSKVLTQRTLAVR